MKRRFLRSPLVSGLSHEILLPVVVLSIVALLPEAARGVNLLAQYSFNEGASNMIRDRSGYGRAGSNDGGVYVASPRGHALRFDGVDDRVEYGGSNGLRIRGSFTIAIWLRTDPGAAKGTTRLIFGDTAGRSVQRNFNVKIDKYERVHVEWGNGERYSCILERPWFLDGDWKYIAVVMVSGKACFFYVNGQLITARGTELPLTKNCGDDIHLGGWSHGYLRGDMAEVRLYNRALSAVEIQQNGGNRQRTANCSSTPRAATAIIADSSSVTCLRVLMVRMRRPSEYACWNRHPGVYLDTTVRPEPCTNALHGCGWVREDGTRAPTYPIFAIRDMMKRLYAIFTSRKPDGFVDAHVYDCLNVPPLAFATGYWNGEQLADKPIKVQSLPPDRFRTEFMGHNLGIPADLLYYMLKDYELSVALAILHDVPVRCEKDAYFDVIAAIYRIRDTFRCDQASFHGYWEPDSPIHVSGSDCYASYWRHPTNGILLAVSNLAVDPRTPGITIDTDKLGLGPAVKTVDVRNESPVPVDESTIRVDLPGQSFMLVHIHSI